MKPAYVTTRQYPGVATVGANGSAIKLWDLFYLEGLNPQLLSAYGGIILGAWHNDYAPILQGYKGIKAILWTSSPGQSQFNELPILEHVLGLLQAQAINYLLFGSKEFYEMFRDDKRVRWFPYPFSQEVIL